MKNVIFIFLTLFIVSCGSQKIATYSYLAGTRGYNLTVVVNEKTIEVVTDNKMIKNGVETKTTVTNPEVWKALQNGSQTIALNEISKLESPTNRRQFDGAMFANLTLTIQDSVFKSASFDHGKPPLMLKTVVDSLVSLSLK